MQVAKWRIYIYHRMGGHETDIGFVIASAEDMNWRKPGKGSVGADIVEYILHEQTNEYLTDG